MNKAAVLLVFFAVLAASASAKTFTFEVGSYEIAKEGEYEILQAENTDPYLEDGELALLRAAFPLTFPETQVVDEIKLISFKDPVNLTLDIPSAFENEEGEFEYAERGCYQESREPEFFVGEPAVLENEATYPIEIYPLEVVDCAEGKFTLWQTAEYEAVITSSTVRIEYVGVDAGAAPGAVAPVSVILNQAAKGQLAIKDITGKDLVAKAVDGDRAVLSIQLPDKYGIEQYILEYRENGKAVAYRDFNIMTSWGSVNFYAYKNDNPSIIPIVINITNYMQEQITAEGALELLDWDGNVTKSIPLSKSLPHGSTLVSMNITVDESQQQNDMRVTLKYDGKEETALHNTVMRIDPEQIKWAKEQLSKQAGEEKAPPSEKSTVLAIIAAVALMAVVAYLALKYMRSREDEA